MAPGDDERVRLVPPLGVKRDSGQVEEFQEVCEELLVGQTHADDVEIYKGPLALETVQRNGRSAQLCDHIDPGKIGPFRQRIRPGVEDLIQHRQPEVGHAQVVDIGKGQADAHGRGVPILDDAVVLPSRVAARLADGGEDSLQSVEVDHHLSPPALSRIPCGAADRRTRPGICPATFPARACRRR